ncbi:uncharacterized protein LOC144351309 [Saccoglossus kowalevskii]
MAYLRLSSHVALLILVFGLIGTVLAGHGKSKNTDFQDAQGKGVGALASSNSDDTDDGDLFPVLTPPMTVLVIYGLVFVLFGISWFPWYIGLRQRRAKKEGISNKAVSSDAMTSTEGTFEITTEM